MSLDALGTPLPRGLYDASMGPTDDRSPPCPTCGCLYRDCPGHTGHLELCVPVYHPLLFQRILILLKIKCLCCHKLRLTSSMIEQCKTKFQLIEQGRTQEAMELEDDIAKAVYRSKEITQNDTVIGSKTNKLAIAHLVGAARDQILREKRQHYPAENNHVETSIDRRIKRELIKDIIADCNKSRKCNHCGAFSPLIRQDACNKFFQAPLSTTHARNNMAEGSTLKSALRTQAVDSCANNTTQLTTSNGYDSDDTRNNDPAHFNIDNNADYGYGPSKQRDHFLHGLEVEAQVKMTWLMEPYLCHSLFSGGAFVNDGYKIFFIRAVPIPPSRFRPPMVLGAMTVEHAQNFYLNKMLNLNDRIRSLFAFEGQTSAQARAYATWIDLQTSVNCFVDSSKDPGANASTNAPAGIRQILEKKEGIFRKYVVCISCSIVSTKRKSHAKYVVVYRSCW